MPLPRKQKPRRKPFVVTFAQAATVALLPGCFSTVTSNPPPTEEPSCPPEQPMQGEACNSDLTCNYEFDVGCGPQPATATCENDAWVIDAGISCNPPVPQPCPPEMPSQGEACSGTMICNYEFDDGCGPKTVLASCQDDVWVINAGVSCNPPVPVPDTCQAIATEAECDAAENCRWLVPGCGMPALPQAGCFAELDCVDVPCADGKTCQEAVVNPCHNKPCDACGMTVSVCLPPAGP
ncbi:hypothetical protein [Polyangium sp. 15x6]|uniref:hypothetical protein n=1 Tax=Polyangium sp. 15x6 TaxID=3042687 RepID=UPI00249A8F07|nr:hypothetical protein [Polyangium sp. 15x6]MDI3287844.1 hypothetical protein [Polyangium sp. 15x6]